MSDSSPVRTATFAYRLRRFLGNLAPHLVLAGYSIFALFPIFMILINSFKTRKAILAHR